jgi:Raf kinase inhibitor-like YbhB/YbcL family protein
MRSSATIAIAVALSIASSHAASGAAAMLSVGSTTFHNAATVPNSMVLNETPCNGKNVSPELHWNAGPNGTKSYALTAWDSDAPQSGGWWHWVVYDIPAGTHRVAEGKRVGTSGTSSFNLTGYDGPCPPPGPAHHYHFTVYALNVAHIGATPKTTGPELLALMRTRVLAQGVIVGLYKR